MVALEADFALLEDPRDQVETLLDLGRTLPPLPESLRQEAFLVRGCQSRVWLVPDPTPERLGLQGDSDAFITKGLVALVLRLYGDRPPAEILASSPQIFERLGLGRLLTPGRANGLGAMVDRVRAVAAAALQA